MNEQLPDVLDLELDLTFEGASEDICSGIKDMPTKCRLTQADPWHDDLKAWIQVLRSDCSLSCPDVVRTTSFLSMGLQLTDDQTITALNLSWRQKNEKTDVLSFPVLDESILHPVDQCVELGDIVISVPTAERQANEMQHALSKELRWLVSHGLLHLLGWDHPTSHRLSEMLSCQQQLLGCNVNLQSHGD